LVLGQLAQLRMVADLTGRKHTRAVVRVCAVAS